MTQPRVAVIGLGIVGMSIAAYLARHGVRVDGLDQFSPPHAKGSSHGENRLIRRAPSEGRVYVEMANRAYALWPELEKTYGKKLFHQVGCIDISEPGNRWAEKSFNLAREFNLPAEDIDIRKAEQLLPIFKFRLGMRMTYSPVSGFLLAEDSVEAFKRMALHHGASLHFGARVEDVDIERATLMLGDGQKPAYDFIFIASGSWIQRFVNLPVKIEKRVLGWYKTQVSTQGVTGFTHGGAEESIYGMPGVDGLTYKIGDDAQLNELQEPDANLSVHARDREFLNNCTSKYLHNLNLESARYAACKYTITEHGGFLIDHHPKAQNIAFFSCCSGHGFKYAPVYGEIAHAFLTATEKNLGINLNEFTLRKNNISLA